MEASAALSFTVLLIGGPSGIGKSTVGVTLARQIGIPWLQVDDLRLALQFGGLVAREQHPALFSFLDPRDWHTTPETYRDKLIAVGRMLTGALRIVVESHIATHVPIIIEGDGILSSFAATIAREYAEGTVRSVFNIEDDEEFLLANMLQRGRGIDPSAETESRRTESRAKALYSRWLKGEARRYGLSTIAPMPRETLAARIIAAHAASR